MISFGRKKKKSIFSIFFFKSSITIFVFDRKKSFLQYCLSMTQSSYKCFIKNSGSLIANKVTETGYYKEQKFINNTMCDTKPIKSLPS